MQLQMQGTEPRPNHSHEIMEVSKPGIMHPECPVSVQGAGLLYRHALCGRCYSNYQAKQRWHIPCFDRERLAFTSQKT